MESGYLAVFMQGVSWLLGLLILLLLARLLLAALGSRVAGGLAARAVCRATDPVVGLVARITPRAATGSILVIFTLVWLLLARHGFQLLKAGSVLASG